jgi:hypothetical protein
MNVLDNLNKRCSQDNVGGEINSTQHNVSDCLLEIESQNKKPTDLQPT